MIKVTVPALPIRNFSGVGRVSQKPFSMDFQTVYLHTVEKTGTVSVFPVKTEIILDKDKNGIPVPYPAGDYNVAPSSIYVDRKGEPAVALRLVQVLAR